jgi:eukaryotic-like serine/threonine-protein kinase
LYYAVTGKVPFPGGTTAEKIRRHLDETPLNPLHFNPNLPVGFCDAIAAMMDKNPDARTPTAAAVVELLRPWRDENATKHFVEPQAPGSGIHQRGGTPAAPAPASLDETASFVLDDLEVSPSQLDSPSQISQGTVSLTGSLEETIAGVQTPRRTGEKRPTQSAVSPAGRDVRFVVIVMALMAAAAVAAAVWWLDLF